jgi:hypothetical protein
LYNDINLIPNIILFKRQRFIKNIIKGFLVICFVLALASLLLLRPYQRFELEKRYSSLTAKINDGYLKELSLAEDQLGMKKVEQKQVEALFEGIAAYDLKITEVIKAIANIMPASITSTKIDYKVESSEISMDLHANNKEEIVLFLKRLYNDSLFSDVNFSGVTGTTTPFNFSIALKIRQEQKTDK